MSLHYDKRIACVLPWLSAMGLRKATYRVRSRAQIDRWYAKVLARAEHVLKHENQYPVFVRLLPRECPRRRNSFTALQRCAQQKLVDAGSHMTVVDAAGRFDLYDEVTNVTDSFITTVPAHPNKVACTPCTSDATCSITLEPVGNGRRLPCGHVFQTFALERWLLAHHTCPCCRAPLPSVMIEENSFPDDAVVSTDFFPQLGRHGEFCSGAVTSAKTLTDAPRQQKFSSMDQLLTILETVVPVSQLVVFILHRILLRKKGVLQDIVLSFMYKDGRWHKHHPDLAIQASHQHTASTYYRRRPWENFV